jgi:hypothetical protein
VFEVVWITTIVDIISVRVLGNKDKLFTKELDELGNPVLLIKPGMKDEVKKEKPVWKKVSKSDAGEPLPVCNCLTNWKDPKNVCPVHG